MFSQCNPSYSGLLCINNPISFKGNSPTATSYNWNFNNEGSNNTTSNPVFHFSTPGFKTVTYSCLLKDGTTCNGQVTFEIKAPPIIRSKMFTDSIQCFENNVFCFRDSSLSGDGTNCIISIKYLFSDGELISKIGTKKNPVSLPATFCRSIIDPQGKTLDLTIEIEDCNGCISRYKYPVTLKVDYAPSINAKLDFINSTNNRVVCHDSAIVKFFNQSNVNTNFIKSFEWDFGDGFKNTSNWDSVVHVYKIGDSMKRSYFPKLSVITLQGCKSVVDLKEVRMFYFNPRIELSRDSICVNDTFKFKLLPEGLNKIIEEKNIIWNFNPGREYYFSGIRNYSDLGPKLIQCYINHECGIFNLFDTMTVIGPLSKIEKPFIEFTERYQCIIQDSVHFDDRSEFYHNDKNYIDDDSLFRKIPGNLGHNFKNGYSVNINPVNLRKNDNVIRLWDFGDDYCEPCTTDIYQNKNLGMNCRFSNEKSPVHWYTPWDSIYYLNYGNKTFQITLFNNNTKTCEKRNVYANDSFYIVTDTLLRYGDNIYGYSARDSIAFKSVRKSKISKGIIGKGIFDSPYPLKVYVSTNDTFYIDKKNGSSLQRIIGPKYQQIQKGERIIVNSNTDNCFFAYNIEINIDTLIYIPNDKYHHLIKVYKPILNSKDSINESLHRQLFFDNIPKCFTTTLTEKDIYHDLKCETVSSTTLALQPPKAQKLKVSNHYCYNYSNKILELSLSETKPGCTQSFAKINFDYLKSPYGWKVINSSDTEATVYRNTFTLSKSPYSYYNAEGPFNDNIYFNFKDSMFNNESIQNVNIGLIIGNGNDNYFCVDTFYYPNFANFPLLKANVDIVGRIKGKAAKVCPNENIYAYDPVNFLGANTIATYSSWALVDKFTYDTLQIIKEYYHKLKTHYKYPNKKVNYTIIERYNIKNNQYYLTQKDTIITAIVHKAKPRLLFGFRNDLLRNEVINAGLNYDDYNEYNILDLIWNGIGIIGNPSTGSRGCVDTTGISQNLYIDYEIDSSTILSFRDTSTLPLDTQIINGKQYQSYVFKTAKRGFYEIVRSVESNYPTYCPTDRAVNVAVGFYGDVIFSDSILCRGNVVEALTQFRYYNTVDTMVGQLDTLDYWKIRETDAGKPGYEGKTVWDFNKDDDDINNPSTIFGSMPYSKTGVGNPTMFLGNEAGGIYYQKSGLYQLRVAASDSNNCVDTFKQNLYVLGPRAGFFIDLNSPNCKTIVEFFDSSSIYDPCVIRGLDPCDFINKWIIDWGDGSPLSEFNQNLPSQIGHDYGINGKFRIKYTIVTVQGCVDTVSHEIFIPGPRPKFIPITRTTICVNDSVKFDNQSILPTSSAKWLWDFGDNIFVPQNDTFNITHQYTKTGEFYVYLHQDDSIPNTGKYCQEIYPDSLNKIKITVLPYDKTTLKAEPVLVCVGDSVKITAEIISVNQYQNYWWRFNSNSYKNNLLIQKYQLNKTGKFKITFQADTNGLNKVSCPNADSIFVFADSVIADFDIDSTLEPFYCFNNKSSFAVSYRWGFFHEKNILLNDKIFIENEKQNEPDRRICQDFRESAGENWVCLEATNANGCKDTVCKKIINRYERDILPPNVFTPDKENTFNGTDKDGLVGNNVFNIYLKGEDYYHLRIYDRWGILMFESHDKNYDWNGKVNNTGDECSDGVYYYILEYRYKLNKKNEPILNGVIHLIRNH